MNVNNFHDFEENASHKVKCFLNEKETYSHTFHHLIAGERHDQYILHRFMFILIIYGKKIRRGHIQIKK